MTVYFGLCWVLLSIHGARGLTFLNPSSPNTLHEIDEGPANSFKPINYILQTDSENQVYYDIISQTPDVKFRAGNTDGFIYQDFDIKYEGPNTEYLLTVVARDYGYPLTSATTTLQIKIKNTNDQAVLSGTFTGQIVKNQLRGTTVSVPIAGKDIEKKSSLMGQSIERVTESGDDTIATLTIAMISMYKSHDRMGYSIRRRSVTDESTTNCTMFSPAYGDVTTQTTYTMTVPTTTNNAGLSTTSIPINVDGEYTYFDVTASATDQGTQALTTTRFIRFSKYNDTSPVCSQSSFTATVSENGASGNTVLTITEYDNNSTDNEVNYTVTGGSGSPLFAVGSSSGIVNTLSTESSYQGEILTQDSSSPTLSTTCTIEITIDTLSDQFASGSVTYTVSEATSVGDNFTTVQVTDVYSSDHGIVYSFSPPSSDFNIGSSDGSVTVAASLDREMVDRYTLTVLAANQGLPQNTASTTVTLSVLDTNDNIPIFTSHSYSHTIAETIPIGTSVGQVQASDFDIGTNAQISYTIESANTGNSSHFTIHSSSGLISSSIALDRESIDSYELVVTATDGGISPLTGSTTVSINLSDVNDNNPAFNSASYSATTVENDSIGAFILTVTITDPDLGVNRDVVLSIDTATPNGLRADTYIEVNSMTSQLSVKQAIDRENDTSFAFTLVATDQGSPARSSSVAVIVTVTDANDNIPIFTSPSYSHTIVETIPIGTSVGQVQASDFDIGTNAQISYTIVSANTGNSSHFTIHSSSGLISSAIALDRESIDSYELIVTATDGGKSPLTGSTTVSINLSDVNDNNPAFNSTSYSATTVENDSIGALILTVTITDPDLGVNRDVVLSIDTATPNGLRADTYIEVNSMTSALSVKQAIDRENDTSFAFSLIATDQGSPARSSSVAVTVTVTDANDNTPVFSSPFYTFNISESASLSMSVGTVVATDTDAGTNAEITYTIDSENNRTSSHFMVDAATGYIKTNANLDRETTDTYELIISATDGGSNPRSDTTSITIYINDENDNTPTFDSPSYSVSTTENQAIGTMILIVTITDIDFGVNSDIVLSIDTSTLDGLNADMFLHADSLTSQLYVKQVIDRETDSAFNFTLVATDQGTPSLNSSVSISIDVVDVNDNSPIFSRVSYSMNVSEAVAISSSVGNVDIIDSDDGLNSQVAYSIVSFLTGNNTHFSINSTNGILETSAVLDRETEDTYEIVVIAVDGGTSPLTGTSTVTVHVTDYNDKVPTFSMSSYNGSLSESDPVGTSILSVTVTDADFGVNADIVLNVDTSTAAGSRADLFFNVDFTTSEISIKTVIDREADDFFIFTLVAKDQGTPTLSSSALINVSVLDVNDNVPVFSSSFYSTEIAYNDTCQVTVTTVTATDADLGINGDVSLTTSRPYNSTVFAFNTTTGDVTAINTMDKDSMYLMYINATDGAFPPLTTEAIVRIDTYAPPDTILNYHMDISCGEYLSSESTFLSQLTGVYNLTYPTCSVRRWCVVNDFDDSSCIVRVYIIANGTADELHELNNSKCFLSIDDAFNITASNDAGTPADVLSGPSWATFAITKVEKYGQNSNLDEDEDEDSNSWLVSAMISGLAGTSVLVVMVVVYKLTSSSSIGAGGPQQIQSSLPSGNGDSSMPRVSVEENSSSNNNSFRPHLNEQRSGNAGGSGGPRIVNVQPIR